MLARPQNLHSIYEHAAQQSTGLQEEGSDLFASLDRSLAGADDKSAIFRADCLVYRMKGKPGEAPGVVAEREAVETKRDMSTGGKRMPGDGSVKARRSLSPPPLPPRPSGNNGGSPQDAKAVSPAVVTSVSGSADVGGTDGSGDGGPSLDSRDITKREAGRGQLPVDTNAIATTPAATAVEGGQRQLKAVSSIFGSSVGRIRSAAKLVAPSSIERPQKSDDALIEATTAAVTASAEAAVEITPARSPRRGFMQSVGLPRRRASCASPTARPPSHLNSSPPLAHRHPSLPPRVVTPTASHEGLSPDGGVTVEPLPQDADGSTVGATNSVVLDGLRLVWNLEIRDSVVSEVAGKS